ncbi:MAG: hypothetical protein OXC01_18975 [Immundisolibacterales bacterium]|nr:hypothetical protein [Immundisolibacterales bacterium]
MDAFCDGRDHRRDPFQTAAHGVFIHEINRLSPTDTPRAACGAWGMIEKIAPTADYAG